MASERASLENFWRAVGRIDLFEARPGSVCADHAVGDVAFGDELQQIFTGRTTAEWVALGIGAPAQVRGRRASHLPRAPAVGDHTEEVLREVAGQGGERLAELREAGTIPGQGSDTSRPYPGPTPAPPRGPAPYHLVERDPGITRRGAGVL